MARTAPPQAGYNTNIRHAGKLFHLQTEDLGRQRAEIESVLFVDGGRIIESLREPYGLDEKGGEPTPEALARQIRAQHKGVLVALRDGVYDAASGLTAEDVLLMGAGARRPPAIVLVEGMRLKLGDEGPEQSDDDRERAQRALSSALRVGAQTTTP